MKRFTLFVIAVGVALAPMRAHAHGAFNMLLGSTASGGGSLKLDYEFTSVSTLSLAFPLSTPGTPNSSALFTGQEPSITLRQTVDLAEPSYVLASGTDVTVEITAIDDGVAIQIVNDDGTTTCTTMSPCTLRSVRDTATLGVVGSGSGQTLNPSGTENPDPHIHPTFSLTLSLDDSGNVQYGEGRVSFKLTTTSGSYTASPIYTLKLSNGPLPHFDYDTGAYASKSVACQQKVGQQVQNYINQKLNALRPCLDKIQVYVAYSDVTPPGDPKKAAALAKSVAGAQTAAEKACADSVTPKGADTQTMLGKIVMAHTKAMAEIQKKCGTPGAPAADGKTIPTSATDDLDDNAILQVLGLAGCRAEEQAAAAYGGALDDLEEYTARATQSGLPQPGGLTLDNYFPCLYSTAAE